MATSGILILMKPDTFYKKNILVSQRPNFDWQLTLSVTERETLLILAITQLILLVPLKLLLNLSTKILSNMILFSP